MIDYRTLVLVNPNAKGVRKKGYQELEDKRRFPYVTVVVVEDKNYLRPVLEHYNEIDIVATLSGDGGNLMFFSQLFNEFDAGEFKKPLFIPGGGTREAFSKALGHRGTSTNRRGVYCFDELYRKESLETQVANLLKVEPYNYYGFALTNGMMVDFYRDYNALKERNALIGWNMIGKYLGLLIGSKVKKEEMCVEVGEEKFLGNFHGVLVNSVPLSLLLAFNFPHNEHLRVNAGSLTIPSLIENLCRSILRCELSLSYMRDTDNAIIRNPGDFVLDGEVIKNTEDLRLSSYPVNFVGRIF